MENFFPEGYKLPDQSELYLKLKIGATRLRVLGSPVVGKKGWKTTEDGKKMPVRKHPGESFDLDEIDDPEEIKTFWAMPVYDYSAKMVKIWEPTQMGILKKIVSLTDNEAFGSPVNYDLYIERSGEGLKTKYEITANPPKPVEESITNAWDEVKQKGFDLTELYTNGDPWNPTKVQ